MLPFPNLALLYAKRGGTKKLLTFFGRPHFHAAVRISALLTFVFGAQHAQASSLDHWEEF